MLGQRWRFLLHRLLRLGAVAPVERWLLLLLLGEDGRQEPRVDVRVDRGVLVVPQELLECGERSMAVNVELPRLDIFGQAVVHQLDPVSMET